MTSLSDHAISVIRNHGLSDDWVDSSASETEDLVEEDDAHSDENDEPSDS